MPTTTHLRRGVVAVVAQEQRLLVIRRSRFVSAPRQFCFPGGHIEPGESDETALCRELLEELACPARPIRLLWECVSRRNVHLRWWLAASTPGTNLVPRPEEVESFHWMTIPEMEGLPDLLDSNRQFLDAWRMGQFTLDGCT